MNPSSQLNPANPTSPLNPTSPNNLLSPTHPVNYLYEDDKSSTILHLSDPIIYIPFGIILIIIIILFYLLFKEL
ncbi:putative membrane protein [Bacillus phage AR9]|uniref:Uncharacterized protein n=2 Tax=Bacillus phage PBS1 TaxID=10683 RepID=A0A223LDL2_BPPB1|nr:hypothetical protein BI022_gp149 [Bacillus phage AR9]YP_009664240.1 hypothetical protein FK780_gp038 [Bacillus phage PBS1]AMS01234.1 putative membrane protein [Bacillus phage AR9]AST99860.1 hypothetical protein PBI_PBS1_38 [Bacillus phage PBS1]BDE75320.1 hypothetical protein [Bacillus phage PBS1]